DLVKKYGENIEQILKFFVKKCEKKIEKIKFSHRLEKQLSQLHHKKISLITIYNIQFIPINIFRL
ncbi:MAG: hypothetical protein JXJ04_07365, partial [Spirochaetales bacterium]|nr:hypothetical protein [Spirochaetales bacterium]